MGLRSQFSESSFDKKYSIDCTQNNELLGLPRMVRYLEWVRYLECNLLHKYKNRLPENVRYFEVRYFECRRYANKIYCLYLAGECLGPIGLCTGVAVQGLGDPIGKWQPLRNSLLASLSAQITVCSRARAERAQQ